MTRILPYPLWIGHAGDSQDFGAIIEQGIEAVIELAIEEQPLASRRGLIACRFPLTDGAGNRPELLALAVRTVGSLVASDVPTLVCCGSGLSRSPAVLASALALAHQEIPEACLKWVTRHHPSDVSPGLWHDLVAVVPRAAQLANAPPPSELRS